MKLVTATAAAALTLTTVAPAHAIEAGEAVTICKNEVAARYGAEADTKIRRIRSGRVARVKLMVRGVSEKSFIVECKVNGDQEITSFTDKRSGDVAAR